MRSQLDYCPGLGKLNNAASSSPSANFDLTTGIRISTGINSGDFIELTDAQANALSTNGVIAVNILTAGSGQTNGTYTANASTGTATISYTVSGNAVTAVAITNSGNGQYTAATAPTFTLAANGGTAGTVQAVVGQLFAGRYQRVKLTSTVTSVIVGQACFWNRADTSDPYAVSTVASGLIPDWAGTIIDPVMGTTPAGSSQASYAWIQVGAGKHQVLGKTSLSNSGTPAIADPIVITASGNTYDDPASAAMTGALVPTYIGTALTAPLANSLATSTGPTFLAEVTRTQTRY
jgi:hypothetical protein